MIPNAVPEHQPQQLPDVPIGPVPTSWLIGDAETPDGKHFVVFRFSTPNGVQAYFFDPDAAEQFCKKGSDQARMSRTGLQLARDLP